MVNDNEVEQNEPCGEPTASDALVTAVVAGLDDVKKRRRTSKSPALPPAANYPTAVHRPLLPLDTPPDLRTQGGNSPLMSAAVTVAESYRIPLAEAVVLLWHSVASVAVAVVVVGDVATHPKLQTAIRTAAPAGFSRAASALAALLPKGGEPLLVLGGPHMPANASRYALWHGDDLAMAPPGFCRYSLSPVLCTGGPVMLPPKVRQLVAAVPVRQSMHFDRADLLDAVAAATRACHGKEQELVTLMGAMMALSPTAAVSPGSLDRAGIDAASRLLQALHDERSYYDDNAQWRRERQAAIALCEWIETVAVRGGGAVVWPSTQDIRRKGPRASGCRQMGVGTRLLQKMQRAGWIDLLNMDGTHRVAVNPDLFTELEKGTL